MERIFCIALRKEKEKVYEEARRKEKHLSEEVMSLSKKEIRG